MKQRLHAFSGLVAGMITTLLLAVPAFAGSGETLDLAGSNNPNTGDVMGQYLPIVIGALIVSAIAIVVVMVTSKKKGKGKKRKGRK